MTSPTDNSGASFWNGIKQESTTDGVTQPFMPTVNLTDDMLLNTGTETVTWGELKRRQASIAQHDGGPAFPGSSAFSPKGMSLRDWFASRAPEPPPTWWGGGAKDCAGYALWNFQYADAMLAERAK